jgi:hypothetical protein
LIYKENFILEELNAVAKELDQFRKSTNTKMSYPKVIKDKVVSLLDKGFPVSKVSETTGIHCTTLGKWKSGQKKESPFIAPEIISDNKTSGGITLITGLSSDDLLKVLSTLQ